MAFNEKFITILKKWPPNPNRQGRTFGYRLRELAKISASGKNPFSLDPKEFPQKLNSLQRLSSNYYGKQYSNSVKIAASGIPLKDLKNILNDEFAVNYQNKWYFKLLRK